VLSLSLSHSVLFSVSSLYLLIPLPFILSFLTRLPKDHKRKFQNLDVYLFPDLPSKGFFLDNAEEGFQTFNSEVLKKTFIPKEVFA
jgi:hypothetical protein